MGQKRGGKKTKRLSMSIWGYEIGYKPIQPGVSGVQYHGNKATNSWDYAMKFCHHVLKNLKKREGGGYMTSYAISQGLAVWRE